MHPVHRDIQRKVAGCVDLGPSTVSSLGQIRGTADRRTTLEAAIAERANPWRPRWMGLLAELLAELENAFLSLGRD